MIGTEKKQGKLACDKKKKKKKEQGPNKVKGTKRLHMLWLTFTFHSEGKQQRPYNYVTTPLQKFSTFSLFSITDQITPNGRYNKA